MTTNSNSNPPKFLTFHRYGLRRDNWEPFNGITEYQDIPADADPGDYFYVNDEVTADCKVLLETNKFDACRTAMGEPTLTPVQWMAAENEWRDIPEHEVRFYREWTTNGNPNDRRAMAEEEGGSK